MSGRIYIGDFEVFKYDTMLCLIDCYAGEYIDIVNDQAKMQSFYSQHKDDIIVFYNGRRYDKWIYKAWVLGYSQAELYKLSQALVFDHVEGWSYDNKFNNIQLYDFDVAKISDGGLKSLEAYMGENIIETSVDFDIDRPLTDDELQMTLNYCHSDIDNTFRVFMERKNDFSAQMDLITAFDLPLSYISKTQAQTVSRVLECTYQSHDDQFDVIFVDTIRLGKYEYIKEWFIKQLKLSKEQGDYTKETLRTDVAGLEHFYRWGGVHAAKQKYHCVAKKKGVLIIHCDVQSFYPSLAIKYGFTSRNSKTPHKYKEIYDKRIALKKAGKKKEQQPLKICLNSAYGVTKDSNSQSFDARQANCICINGMLALTDLLDKLEVIPGFQCDQSNTDGIIIEIPDTDEAFEQLDDICYEWEQRLGIVLEFENICQLNQGNVNNYIAIFDNGKLERKGAYLQESTPLKNNLTIVNTAMVERLVHGTPVEKTINDCDDLSQFMQVAKLSSKYDHGYHNGERLKDRTYRVYASLDTNNDSVYKQKGDDGTHEKFASLPDHCVIYNHCLDGVTPKDIGLDKQFYIDLAKKRLKESFGVED